MGKPVSLLVADHDIDASYFSSNIFLIDFDGIDCAWKGVTAESSLCYATNPSLVVPANRIFWMLPHPVDLVLRMMLLMLPKQLGPKPVPYGGITVIDPEC
jgi:hypothetical protein